MGSTHARPPANRPREKLPLKSRAALLNADLLAVLFGEGQRDGDVF